MIGGARRRVCHVLFWAMAALAWPVSPAGAGLPEIDLPEGFSAVLDLRLVGVDGERSWLDGGFGKARFGAGDGDFEVEPVPVNGQLIWEPSLGWDLDGTLVVGAQDGQDQPVDVV